MPPMITNEDNYCREHICWVDGLHDLAKHLVSVRDGCKVVPDVPDAHTGNIR